MLPPLGVDIGIGQAVTGTPKALFIGFDRVAYSWLDERLWVPRSQITGESEVQETGDAGVVIVSEWFARKLGFWVRQ